MNIDELKRLLASAASRLNSGTSQALTARLETERPPLDARHLTDTRTRVSTLLEYALGYELNQVFASGPQWVSNVLWNRFPDLLVRDSNGQKVAGLEIKALHVAAEEKSANFGTEIGLVQKDVDFVVVMLWAWSRANIKDAAVVIPSIKAIEVFCAWQLAKMRDYGWLSSLRGRAKLIDLESAVIQVPKQDVYKLEEKNLGKLMRLAPTNALCAGVPGYQDLMETVTNYRAFIRKTHVLSVREICRELLILLGGDERGFSFEIEAITEGVLTEVGHGRVGNMEIGFLYGPNAARTIKGTAMGIAAQRTHLLHVTDQLKWRVFARESERWVVRAEGSKPEGSYQRIIASLQQTD